MSFLDRFFGPSYEKELAALQPLVVQINALEDEIAALDNEGLVARTRALQAKVQAGASLDSVLVEAFALVRESSKRTLGLRPYDVQLIGGALLHSGKITEMRTGEGKTLVGTFPAYLNALAGKGAKLQIYCSEDLGSFYLDILKDRLYTTGAKSLARRSAQTVLHQITHAMLRWMAPFLSFTAEEAWKLVGNSESIYTQTYATLAVPDDALLAKWTRIREIRDAVNKDIEVLRADGKVGSSLQASVALTVNAQDHALLSSLGDDLKFVFITSTIELVAGDALSTRATASKSTKCERCWHYRDDIGIDAAHPTICGRCTSNLDGAGEVREFA